MTGAGGVPRCRVGDGQGLWGQGVGASPPASPQPRVTTDDRWMDGDDVPMRGSASDDGASHHWLAGVRLAALAVGEKRQIDGGVSCMLISIRVVAQRAGGMRTEVLGTAGTESLCQLTQVQNSSARTGVR